MIKITVSTKPVVRLFDRMPLPRNSKSRSTIIGKIMLNRGASLNRFSTNPFVRKVSRIA